MRIIVLFEEKYLTKFGFFKFPIPKTLPRQRYQLFFSLNCLPNLRIEMKHYEFPSKR